LRDQYRDESSEWRPRYIALTSTPERLANRNRFAIHQQS